MILDSNGRPITSKDYDGTSLETTKNRFRMSQEALEGVADAEQGTPQYNADGSDRVSQEAIDLERARVMLTRIEQCLISGDLYRLHREEVTYLWWPTNRIHAYELRTGNPPANADRPKHLRHKRLELDYSVIPDWMKYAMIPGGLVSRILDKALEDHGIMRDQQNVTVLRQLIKLRIADKIRKEYLVQRRALS